jgi:hypothetical protein
MIVDMLWLIFVISTIMMDLLVIMYILVSRHIILQLTFIILQLTFYERY